MLDYMANFYILEYDSTIGDHDIFDRVPIVLNEDFNSPSYYK